VPEDCLWLLVYSITDSLYLHYEGLAHGFQPMRAFSISIIIPTNRREFPKLGTLADLLTPLCASGLPIIEVVLAGSWPPSFIKNKRRISMALKTVPCKDSERSLLRNRAASKATGTHLLFLDDDTIALPSAAFIDQVFELRRGELLTFACRRYLRMGAMSGSELAKAISHGEYFRLLANARDSTEAVADGPQFYTHEVSYASNFGVMHRSAFRQLGGFDTQYVGWGFEDVDLMNRVVAKHSIISCKDSCSVIHLDHMVSPYRRLEGARNHLLYLEKRRRRKSLPPYSAVFHSLAALHSSVVPPYRPVSRRTIADSLEAIPQFKWNRRDRLTAAAHVRTLATKGDFLGFGIYGSAMHSRGCRDVDLCVIRAFGDDRFFFRRLPSGKPLELHLTSLWSIGRQIADIYLLGDNAGLIYQKWRTFKLLHEDLPIVSSHLSQWTKEDPNAWPYLFSLYVGLIKIYQKKARTAERLCLGRYVTAAAALAGVETPQPSLVLSSTQLDSWLHVTGHGVAARYKREFRGGRARSILRYPPNFIGDKFLREIST
jgi:hypothetical protein